MRKILDQSFPFVAEKSESTYRLVEVDGKCLIEKVTVSISVEAEGLCLESGGNSLAAFSEHVDLGLIRPRGQV
ncbi:hypothetical protein [uncultured Pseudophaeobacter sp.]|jgi:hypothetical protein|uniref:hypothetical protein n=1 Tax=uncultured Pseudophaeobacter sp. TaxID=1759421 RepID=UPI0025CC54A1|nr:hypothetical protein [uncultured Pseudophaeobacter sp.]